MLTIKVNKRTATGTRACKKLRREGNIPANIYGPKDGQKKENISIVLPVTEVQILLQKRGEAVQLEIEKEQAEEVVVKEVQRDPVHDRVVHIDFLRSAATPKL